MRTIAASAPVTGCSCARAGLLGNPGDAYGGKAIGLAVRNFRACVTIAPADRLTLRPGPSDRLDFPGLREACGTLRRTGCEDGMRLLRAALSRFSGQFPELLALPDDDPRVRFEMRYETDVPRQVGLAGSSAIITAALRALARWFGVEIAPALLAELALAAELAELRIVAGAMDRVVQAYEGVILMDLAEPRSEASYRRLDPALLPPLLVAWDPAGAEASGRAHGDLRSRWERGDPELREAMHELREIVDAGVRCLEGGDAEGLRRLVDRNFDIRARIFRIREADRRVVALARERGAAAKLCGSGGAVLLLPKSASEALALATAVREAGYDALVPRVAPEAAETAVAL